MLQIKAAKAFSQQTFLILLTSIWQDASSLGNSRLSLGKYFYIQEEVSGLKLREMGSKYKKC